MYVSGENSENMCGAVKRALIYKLILLENARNALSRELNHFTKQTAEEIEGFLTSSCASRSQDGVKMLKTLDAKCHIIHELNAVFEDLKSEEKRRPYTMIRSPQDDFQFCHSGAFVPHVLKFGSLLQSVIRTCSIRRAAQIVGATLSLQHLTSSPRSEESPDKISPRYSAAMEFVKHDGFKLSETETVSAAETRRNMGIPKSNPAQNVTPKYQTQTSSQLIQVPGVKKNTKRVPELNLASTRGVFALMYQPKSKPPADMDPNNVIHISEMNISGSEAKNGTSGSRTFDLSKSSVLNPFHSSGSESQEGLDQGLTGAPEVVVSVPEFQVKKFEEMPVVVSHVVSPNQFYVQHKDSNLQELSEAMARKICKSYAESNRIPDRGSYVMGWVPKRKTWCRAQVLQICGVNSGSRGLCSLNLKNAEVKVRTIDYGDSAQIPLRNIRDLCAEAVEVPAQALQVSLAEIMCVLVDEQVSPVYGESWSDEAVGWFRDKVKNRTLYARFYPEEHRVNVELFMEKGKIGVIRRGAPLSLKLALNGHARHPKLKNMLRRHPAKEMMEWEKYLISSYCQNRQ